jgi:hypothetical protein
MRNALDELLDGSSPTVPWTDGIRVEIGTLASEHARQVNGRFSTPTRARAALVVTAVVALLLGGVSTAAVGTVLARGWQLTSPDIEYVRAYPSDPSITCTMRLRFQPADDANPTAADFDEARAFFDSLDLTTISTNREFIPPLGVPGASKATTELNAFNFTVFILWSSRFQDAGEQPSVVWSSESKCSDADEQGLTW